MGMAVALLLWQRRQPQYPSARDAGICADDGAPSGPPAAQGALEGTPEAKRGCTTELLGAGGMTVGSIEWLASAAAACFSPSLCPKCDAEDAHDEMDPGSEAPTECAIIGWPPTADLLHDVDEGIQALLGACPEPLGPVEYGHHYEIVSKLGWVDEAAPHDCANLFRLLADPVEGVFEAWTSACLLARCNGWGVIHSPYSRTPGEDKGVQPCDALLRLEAVTADVLRCNSVSPSVRTPPCAAGACAMCVCVPTLTRLPHARVLPAGLPDPDVRASGPGAGAPRPGAAPGGGSAEGAPPPPGAWRFEQRQPGLGVLRGLRGALQGGARRSAWRHLVRVPAVCAPPALLGVVPTNTQG